MRKAWLIIVGLLLVSGTAFAQDDLLSYGDTVIGDTGSSYTFTGSTGDLVTIQVIGVDTHPTVSLSAANEQALISSDTDVTGSADVRLSYSLPQDGIYTISVSGTPGEFVLRLNGRPPVAGQALTNIPMLVNLAGETQTFTFSADPVVPTSLNISAEAPNFSFSAMIRNSSGQFIALITKSTAITVTLPFGEGAYFVEVASPDSTSSGQISIGLGSAAAGASPDDACMVSAQGSAPVNVRSGPGVDFESLALLEQGRRIAVTAVSGTWYQVDMPDVGVGWMRRDVVVGFGNCDNVPVVTEEPTAAPITLTFTPTNTATETPTETATPIPPTVEQTEEASATPTEVEPSPTATITPSTTPVGG